ncbi:EF-hand domain-containing protein 1-like [Cimex lectularius]|uniref:DM10 domain-containing protein n=1 Tax=Cimex lectularius TaxID=79782 RepID=A0A8I6RYM1_CIMLE|nr:EF-hand domain-containing protein 1-like [Cimex lectularius]
MEGLPLLPGYSFSDVTRTKHFKPRLFEWRNGYPLVKHSKAGIGNTPLDVQSVLFTRGLDSVRYDPSLTYGRTKNYKPETLKPHFVLYDKKCLTFKAFFKQGVPNSPDEHFRVRLVNIVYFLEDDTITVMEPPVQNAGFPQGRIVTRNRIRKPNGESFYHWKDLNTGIEIEIYGIVYHLCSCDSYTREYLMSQGVELNDDECLPQDPYTRKRMSQNTVKTSITPSCEDKMYKFLAYDKKILRFWAVWDDRDSEHGTLNFFKIHYYLGDDEMEVIEEIEPNSGKDMKPVLVRKSKIPKNWRKVREDFPSIYMEKIEEDFTEHYGIKDLVIGNTLFIYGRRFLLVNCDNYTRVFYREMLRIEQPPPIDMTPKKTVAPSYSLPRYSGFGTHEDSLQSWNSFIPKPPKKDLIRYLLNMRKILRYMAVMDYIHPEDKDRRFVLEYRLSDGCLSVHETRLHNSGFEGGKFLAFTLVPKPNTSYDNPEYYTPVDFTLGSIVNCFGHRFKIIGIDLAVYRYMEANPEKFRPEVVSEVRKHLVREGHLNEDIKDVAEYRKHEEIAEPVIYPNAPEYNVQQVRAAKEQMKLDPPDCTPINQQMRQQMVTNGEKNLCKS